MRTGKNRTRRVTEVIGWLYSQIGSNRFTHSLVALHIHWCLFLFRL